MESEMKSHNYIELIIRTQEGEATASETEALQEWLEVSVENRKIFAAIETLRRVSLAQRPQNKPDVKTAWRNVENCIRTGGSLRIITSQPRQSILSKLFAVWNWRLAGACTIFLIVALYSVYRWNLPQNYELAFLSKWDERNLATETRSEQSDLQSESARAAEALMSACQKRLGIFPYFDAQRVAEAIARFRNAYSATADPVSRNKYAFYIAKAFLMQEKVEQAREWLNRVLASNAVAYQDEAKILLERLE